MTTALQTAAPSSRQFRNVPIDLTAAPAVTDFLVSTGLGAFVPDRLTSPPGRNRVWIGETTTGRRLFVKQLLGAAEEVPARMARLLSFEEFARQAMGGAPRLSPTLVTADRGAGIVAFEVVTGARSGAELMVDEEFGPDIAHQVGRALGQVHAAPIDPALRIDTSPVFFPSAMVLRALPGRLFETLAFGEIEAWRLLQNDPELIAAVERLLVAEQGAPRTPAHCDLRMDQLLFDGDQLLIADWEEFRLSDAARDVGAFVGEWLYRAVLDIVTTRGQQSPIGDTLSHEDVLRRGVANLHRHTPCIRAFWEGYRQVRPGVDATLPDRATAFAGWHTIDRLLAGGTRRTKLTGIERAAAGIGRSALVHPARFSTVIGLGETA